MGGSKKEEEAMKKPDVGASGIARRMSSRATSTKQAARDVASGKKLTLETVTKGKK